MRVDLHLHSSLSDGKFTPEQVVAHARRGGLDVISIADHDSIASYDRAAAVCPPGLRVIRASEISSRFESTEYHILGYFPEDPGPSFLAFLSRAQQSRRERMAVGLEALRARGLTVTMEAIERRAAGTESIGRNHVAQYLVDSDQVPSLSEAFERHLKYALDIVPRTTITSAQAIALIREHGGIPVWAHPTGDDFDAHVRTLHAAGLRGVEIYTRRRLRHEAERFEAVCDELGLLATVGSDWHGNGKRPSFMTVACDETRIEEFLSHIPAADAARMPRAEAVAAPKPTV